ncbi:transferase [Streptomyces ziwulingensis]|uniref:Transferase n=1 Tax=Streptomyces ziwulingensis TaxID=1045501 RepID=A0ABP9B3D9_9ACTN
MTTDEATATDHRTQPRLGCTADRDGGITFGLRPAPPDTGARLLLRLRPRKGEPETVRHLLDLAPDADGHPAAVLPARQTLAAGRWDTYLLTGAEADGTRLRLRPGMRDLRALVDGRTRDRPAPVAVRVPYVTKDGFLAIRSWLRDVHAETGALTYTGTTVTVQARLHGAEFGAGATVRLRRRGTGTERVLTARPAGDRRGFSFTADLAELTAGHGGGPAVWDVFVHPAEAAPPVRLARLLDDLAHRKDIDVQPATTVGDTVLRPYFTAGNDLSVAVTPA